MSARPRAALSARDPVTRRRLGRLIKIVASIALVVVSIWWVVLPQLPDSQRAAAAVRSVSWPLVALAVVVEGLSLLSYTAMTRALLTNARSSFGTLLRIDLTVLGASHALPAGGATAAALRYRLWRRIGVGQTEALSGAAVQATIGNAVLGAIFLLGAMLSAVEGASISGYLVAITATAAIILLAVGAGWALIIIPDRVTGAVQAISRHLPSRIRDSAAGLIRSLSGRLTSLVEHPSSLRRVTIFAAGNWLLDSTVVGILLVAVGHPLSIGRLLTVYGIANLLAVVPLTPGGLGVVEAAMVSALVGFGVPSTAALLVTLGWRLLQFWLPIPTSGLTYLSLAMQRGADASDR
ncbi:MAG TPA: lysylphosphatidylglycerol synthase transmembrane domain-containing protein [Microlunatus sp.]|nr:lysylphosphatidylglycerol synthase transmembrane domain-containing protein [Microlunatus sp.]